MLSAVLEHRRRIAIVPLTRSLKFFRLSPSLPFVTLLLSKAGGDPDWDPSSASDVCGIFVQLAALA
eukprot:9443753-Pyramimonas_sp.AAC.1